LRIIALRNRFVYVRLLGMINTLRAAQNRTASKEGHPMTPTTAPAGTARYIDGCALPERALNAAGSGHGG
jgi:hypothetical protein